VRVDDRGRVNANSDPGEDAVLDAVAEVHVVEDGIGVGGLVSKDTVVDVEQEYGSKASASLMSFWSKKSWPTWEMWPPVRVWFLALTVALMCARTVRSLALSPKSSSYNVP
jgi:hypothetical protein